MVLPSTINESMSPCFQSSSLFARHTECSFALDLEDGFCSMSAGKTKAAVRAIGSRAELSPYDQNKLESSFTNALPAFPDGILKRLRFQCTISEKHALIDRTKSGPDTSFHLKEGCGGGG